MLMGLRHRRYALSEVKHGKFRLAILVVVEFYETEIHGEVFIIYDVHREPMNI